MTELEEMLAFGRARLAEDEQAARAAAHEMGDAPRWATRGGEVIVPLDSLLDPQGIGMFTVARASETPVTEHIARHDPARVLAEVEAKRQIIAEHGAPRPEQRNYACASNCTDRQNIVQEAPCRTLRLLVLPYADHPDYKSSWRP